MEPLIYDVSEPAFCPTITDFNLHNVYSACRAAKITDRLNLHIALSLTAYDMLDANNEIDHYPDGTMKYHAFTVSINDCFGESIITDPEGKSVTLITRDYP